MKFLPWAMILILYISILLYRILYIDISFDIEVPDVFVQLRQEFDQRLAQFLPSPNYELLSGILLGEKKNLPNNLKLALRDTSTLHIVVVSGQNLSMISGFLLLLAGLVHRRIAIFISFCAIVFYTLLTGAQIPVVRAAIMATLSLTAVFLGRARDGIWMLFISGAVMLVVNPMWITDLSFQLSFLATFGVIGVAPVINKYISHLPEIIKQDLSVAIGAQLMVTPIIAQYFHQFSVVGVIVNILVGWTIGIIMILGSILILISYISVPLAQIISFVTMGFLDYFLYIVYFFAGSQYAWEYVGEKSWLYWIGYYLILLGAFMVMKTLDKK